MRLLLAFAALLAAARRCRGSGRRERSSSGVKAPHIPAAIAPAGTPPHPPHGALVLAKGHGDLAVALAARRAGSKLRLTGTVVAADGTGLTGLRVRFAVAGRELPPAAPCGPGCYASATRVGAPVRHVVIALERSRPSPIDRRLRPAGALAGLGRAAAAWRRSRVRAAAQRRLPRAAVERPARHEHERLAQGGAEPPQLPHGVGRCGRRDRPQTLGSRRRRRLETVAPEPAARDAVAPVGRRRLRRRAARRRAPRRAGSRAFSMSSRPPGWYTVTLDRRRCAP